MDKLLVDVGRILPRIGIHWRGATAALILLFASAFLGGCPPPGPPPPAAQTTIPPQDKGAKALFYSETGATVSSQSPSSASIPGTPSQRPAPRVAPPVPVRQDMVAAPQQGAWLGMAFWVELQRGNVTMHIQANQGSPRGA